MNDSVKNESNIVQIVKSTLNNDLVISLQLLDKELNNPLRKRIISEDFDYINNRILGLKTSFSYPTVVPFDEICAFYSLFNQIEEDYYNKCTELFYTVNNFHSRTLNQYSITRQEDGILNVEPVQINDLNDEKSKKILIAVANINMPEAIIDNCDFSCSFVDNFSIDEFKKLMSNAKRIGASTIVFPEFALPNNYLMDVVLYSKKIGISIVVGLSHFCIDKAYNVTLIRDNDLNLTILKHKNYIPYDEKVLCSKHGFECYEPDNPYYLLINNNLYVYSTMTCFEATCIKDRALLSDKIEILYMPVYNKDTEYFSSIVGSFSRDSSSFVVVSNNNEYGDSRITGPYGHIKTNIVKLKGGINNFFVVGEIDFADYEKKYSKNDELAQALELRIYGLINNEDIDLALKKFKDVDFKPLSAGKNRNIERENNKIRKSSKGK